MSKKIKELYLRAGLTPPDGKGEHTEKFHRCVVAVKKRMKIDGKKVNPYAVCMESIGREEAVKESHQSPFYKKGGK